MLASSLVSVLRETARVPSAVFSSWSLALYANDCTPGPLWLAVMYDGVDFDEIVVVITSATGLVEIMAQFTTLADIPAWTVQPLGTVLGAADPP